MGDAIRSLYDAKTHLSELVERAARGEEFVITKNGVAKARLVPMPPKAKRKLGGSEGKIWIADNFDDPLPDWLLDAFEGKDDESPS